MSTCRKCGEAIPKLIWMDGRKKNISKYRSYCLDCSPFGQHNTKELEKTPTLDSDGRIIYPTRVCPKCGKEHNKRGFVCQVCAFKCKFEKKVNLTYDIVGKKCWMCGYDKTTKNLCFHHMNPSKKLFGLSKREINGYSWERVFEEMQKCILVCHNCHGEIHYGLTSKEIIDSLWVDKWKEIRARSIMVIAADSLKGETIE